MTRAIGLCTVLATLSLATAFCQTPANSGLSVQQLGSFTVRNAGSTSAFNSDLAKAAVAKDDGSIAVYSTSGGQEIARFKQLPGGVWPWQVGIQDISFLNKSNDVLILDSEGRFMACDMEHGSVGRVIRLPWFVLYDAEIAADFKDAKRTIGNYELPLLHGLSVRSAQISADEKELAVLYQDGSIVLLDLLSGRLSKLVRKGSFWNNSIIAEVGQQIELKTVQAHPEYFGTRIGETSKWRVPKSIRIDRFRNQDNKEHSYFLGRVGDDVIIEDDNGLARLSLDSATEIWRTKRGTCWSVLTSDRKLIAFVNRDIIHLLRTSDGELHRRIPLKRSNAQDPIVTIAAAVNGEVFVLLSQALQLFAVDEEGGLIEFASNSSKRGVVPRIALSSDGRRIGLLNNRKTVQLLKLETK